MAILNLSAGLVITSWPERRIDLDIVRGWSHEWLVGGADIYARPDKDVDYPPHAIEALSPLSVLSDESVIIIWTIVNLGLAVAAPYLAVRLARPGPAPWPALALPILMFLCWGGFRTLLQFTLAALVFGLLAMKLADRHPAWSGVCLGMALMKPQIAAPFVLWAIFTRRLRVITVSALVVATGFVIFCIRAGANPIAVVQGYADVLQTRYLTNEDLMMVGLAQLRPLIALAIPRTDLLNVVAIALALGLLGTICMLGFAEGRQRDAPSSNMISAPALVGVWSLLTFYHLTYGFVLLLPVATLLIFANEPATRPFRRAVFWALQLGLMVDIPGMWARFAPRLFPDRNVEMWALPAHADRILMSALFVCLLALAIMRSRATRGVFADAGSAAEGATS